MKSKFQRTIMMYALITALIPLILSYIIFINDKIKTIDQSIRQQLYSTAFTISNTPLVQEKLLNKENDLILQNYTNTLIKELNNIDIIVIADMDEIKYSHLDTSQIGEKFVNEDKRRVIDESVGYYSLKKGSMGVTYRRFEPIIVDGKQVGFVMVGKYQESIQLHNQRIKIMYASLLLVSVLVALFLAVNLSKRVKRKILNMEPEDIAKLFLEKKAIINNINNGVIALNSSDQVVEVNKVCYQIFQNFSIDNVMNKLSKEINKHKSLKMKEMMLLDKKVLVSINPIFKENQYLGSVVLLIDEVEIDQIAKEITGVDEMNKVLRANVHEFKNKLHVILGLIQLNELDEAKKFILDIQNVQIQQAEKYKMIDDYHVKAMLLSSELIAKEKNINLHITPNSYLYQKHGRITSIDLITIIGNLLENAFESFISYNNKYNKVSIDLSEDNEYIYIEVNDNGESIPVDIQKRMFERGVSTKGKNRGTGLSLLNDKVDLYSGTINFTQDSDNKKFSITLLKGDKHETSINS